MFTAMTLASCMVAFPMWTVVTGTAPSKRELLADSGVPATVLADDDECSSSRDLQEELAELSCADALFQLRGQRVGESQAAVALHSKRTATAEAAFNDFMASLADSPMLDVVVPVEVRPSLAGLRMTVEVTPATKGGEPIDPQRLVLDSGSSTLAFCDPDLANVLPVIGVEPDGGSLIQCNAYGDPVLSGYWGYVYMGSITLGATTAIANATYNVMERYGNMPCDEANGIQGIFGVGTYQHNIIKKVLQVPSWPEGALGECPEGAATELQPNVLQQALKTSAQQGGWSTWGVGISPVANDGSLYLGAAAARHYGSLANTAGIAKLAIDGSYYVNVLEMSVGSQTWKSNNLPFMLDTGTPSIQLPPVAFKAACLETYELTPAGLAAVPSTCKTTANETLLVKLQGIDSDFTLQLDLAKLNGPEYNVPVPPEFKKYLADQNLTRKQSALTGHDNAVFGLPLWAFYYTLFKMPSADDPMTAVAFVPQ